MADAHALLNTYAEAIPHIVALEPRENAAPGAFIALRMVLDRHGPMQYGDESTDVDLEPTDLWCKECSGDRFHRERFPCRTHRDIANALEADRG